MRNKRYNLTAKRNGKTEARGYIDMKAQETGAELYLYGDIVDDELTAAYFGGTCPQEIADFFNALNPTAPLTIYFNSPGGDVFAGLAIHSIIKRHTGRKTGQVDGMAASIASVILTTESVVADKKEEAPAAAPAAGMGGMGGGMY